MEKIPHIYNPELYAKYIAQRHELALIEDEGALIDLVDELPRFAKDLLKKYGEDVRHIALFHALVGSTIGSDTTITGDDLEGPDSIAKFLDGIYDKYKKYLPKE